MGDAALIEGGVRWYQSRAGGRMHHYTTEAGRVGINRSRRILASEPEELFSVNRHGIHDAGMPSAGFGRSLEPNVFFTDVAPSQMTPAIRIELGINHTTQVVSMGRNQLAAQGPFFANPTLPHTFNLVAPYANVPATYPWGVYFGIYTASR